MMHGHMNLKFNLCLGWIICYGSVPILCCVLQAVSETAVGIHNYISQY